MREQGSIRAAILRGGTSKGVFLHAADLPVEPSRRDRVILAIFGSPDPRQIDGLGGADPLTSKVAIVAPSSQADAEVDSTIGCVGIERGSIDWKGNCGNLSQAIGGFAVDEGLVEAVEPITRVRIFNTNTGQTMLAEVPVRNRRAASTGDFVLPGVPGTGARVVVNFLDAAGSKTGRLLPTGNTVDRVRLEDGSSVRASLVDAAAPAIFVRAAEVGLTGRELPADCARDGRILSVMREIRVQGALMMKLASSPDQVSATEPKIAIVAPPADYTTIAGETVAGVDCDLLARTLAFDRLHKAYAVTGGICLAAAARIEGTVVHEVAGGAGEADLVRVGHPSGVSSYLVRVERAGSGGQVLRKAAVAGTARRIMDGRVYVPGGLLD